MRSWLFLLCPCFFVQADWTVTQPDTITTLITSPSDLCPSYDPSSGNFLAAWGNGCDNGSPVYSFYVAGSGWTPPQNIEATPQTTVGHLLTTAYIPTTGQIMGVWGNSSNGLLPVYSLYTPGSGWSPTEEITDDGRASNITLVFDPNTQKLLATWADAVTAVPIYALYTPGTGWNTPASIAATRAYSDVITAFDSATGLTIAAWAEGAAPYRPIYTIYDPNTGWSTPTPITNDALVYYNVCVTYDSKNGQTLATWQDGETDAPTYSFYTPGHGWSPPAIISNTSAVLLNINSIFSSATGQFLAVWADENNSCQATYSFYTFEDGWSPPATMSTSTVSFPFESIYGAYDYKTDRIMTTWTDGDNSYYPTFSLFTGPPVEPDRPKGFSGRRGKNNFALVSERYNKLSWDLAKGIKEYRLFRDGKLIAVLDPNTSCYIDHNQSNCQQIYSLVAINSSGRSEPATISVGGRCDR